MSQVNVLMSTFNGMEFIEEQIKSILAQEGVNVKIYIRDDGSEDGTYEYILRNYKQIIVYQGNNLGYKKSFLDLLSKVNEDGFYAFADQDDIWDSDKLITAVNRLNQYNDSEPLLYCSNLRVTDENLNYIQLLHTNKEKIKLNKDCALVENLSYGCTTVFNKVARDIAVTFLPKHTSHDGWINLICLFLGKAYYDNIPYISYRQHSKNVLGGRRDLISVWKKRLSTFDYKNHHRDITANEFLTAYQHLLSDQDINVIKKVSLYRTSLLKKMKLFFNYKIRMSNFDRDFWYRVRIIFSCI